MTKILVIDDDPMIVAIYRKAFDKVGYQVDAAFDGRTGLAKFHDWRPHLVLLDINIPEMNGFEWLKAVRGDPHFAKFPIVVLTGGNNRANVLTALGAGATAVLLKSRDEPSRVIDVIRAVIDDAGPQTYGQHGTPGGIYARR